MPENGGPSPLRGIDEPYSQPSAADRRDRARARRSLALDLTRLLDGRRSRLVDAGRLLPVTESEMRALRGYEALNAVATAVTVLSAIALAFDGHHVYVANPWHGHAFVVPEGVDAMLRVLATVGVGLIVPAIVILVSRRGSDWIALVTRRYRNAKILTDPSRER